MASPGTSTVIKVKYTDMAVRSLTCHTAAETRMPYGITPCYLPPDRGDIPAFTPAEADTRLSDCVSCIGTLSFAMSAGSVAEWLACWTQAQEGLGSNRSRDDVG